MEKKHGRGKEKKGFWTDQRTEKCYTSRLHELAEVVKDNSEMNVCGKHT